MKRLILQRLILLLPNSLLFEYNKGFFGTFIKVLYRNLQKLYFASIYRWFFKINGGICSELVVPLIALHRCI